jgi:hypothetical protein
MQRRAANATRKANLGSELKLLTVETSLMGIQPGSAKRASLSLAPCARSLRHAGQLLDPAF